MSYHFIPYHPPGTELSRMHLTIQPEFSCIHRVLAMSRINVAFRKPWDILEYKPEITRSISWRFYPPFGLHLRVEELPLNLREFRRKMFLLRSIMSLIKRPVASWISWGPPERACCGFLHAMRCSDCVLARNHRNFCVEVLFHTTLYPASKHRSFCLVIQNHQLKLERKEMACSLHPHQWLLAHSKECIQYM